MSKKSNKINQTRRMAPAGSRTSGKGAGSKPAGSRPSNGRPASAPVGRIHQKAGEAAANLLAVRITGGVFALLLLAGVLVALLVAKVEMNTGSIITMALLGIMIALGLFAALQPQVVASWVKRLGRQ